jgi:hypothetical protein
VLGLEGTMSEWDVISDFLKEHGREEWGEKVARLTGKVYVVTEGDRALGVFSTREGAMDHPEGDNVEEFIVDDLLDWEVGYVYNATIRMRDGEIYDIGQAQPRNRHASRCLIDEYGIDQDWHYLVVRSPISTAHAMQAAMDRRDQIRAQALFSEDSPRTVPDRILDTPPP